MKDLITIKYSNSDPGAYDSRDPRIEAPFRAEPVRSQHQGMHLPDQSTRTIDP
jgi:hypothetical protein